MAIAGGQHSAAIPVGRNLDELYLHIAPIILGAGERMLENIGDPTLEPIKVIDSPNVTYVKYRVVH